MIFFQLHPGLLFIRGESVVLDRKYPLEKHPSFRSMGEERKVDEIKVIASIRTDTSG